MLDSTLPNKLSKVLALDLSRATKAASVEDTIWIAGSFRGVGIYNVDVRRALVSNIAWSVLARPDNSFFYD